MCGCGEDLALWVWKVKVDWSFEKISIVLTQKRLIIAVGMVNGWVWLVGILSTKHALLEDALSLYRPSVKRKRKNWEWIIIPSRRLTDTDRSWKRWSCNKEDIVSKLQDATQNPFWKFLACTIHYKGFLKDDVPKPRSPIGMHLIH